MKCKFLGEGATDKQIIPILLGSHNIDVQQSDFVTWKSLHLRGRKGFKKKVKLAIGLARLAGLEGLIATLDADKQPDRIKRLKEARNEDRDDRSKLRFPVVIGQANPELEAWLLDDTHAVKNGLRLSAQTKVPSPDKVPDVKLALEQLIHDSSIETNSVGLVSIAELVTCKTSRNPDKTGLRSFIDDARNELALED